ncbi:HisA/HisF family protein [Methylococcus sp. EFPC2]|nr:HisA/HisF family protein [Methylococcus sp. EFPC2]
MQIVPVVDLMGGVAVQARAGLREEYRPLESSLCTGPAPEDVISGLARLHPFATYYIADLDALMGRGAQHPLVRTLAERHPTADIWLDAGWPAPTGPWTPIVGTESLDASAWNDLKYSGRDWILSLDFFHGELRGPREILAQADHWPERVIVMTLNRVGTWAGPDWDRLTQIRELGPARHLIAAGGVRDEHDLDRLSELGIETVLVASALHAGRLHDYLSR